jgi:hypothetical protein
MGRKVKFKMSDQGFMIAGGALIVSGLAYYLFSPLFTVSGYAMPPKEYFDGLIGGNYE